MNKFVAMLCNSKKTGVQWYENSLVQNALWERSMRINSKWYGIHSLFCSRNHEKRRKIAFDNFVGSYHWVMSSKLLLNIFGVF